MNLLRPFLLGTSLSLDCFAMSVSQGLRPHSNPKKAIILLSVLFAGFQGGMLLIGYFVGFSVSDNLGDIMKWISAALLVFIGAKMVKESFEDNCENEKSVDHFKEMLILSVATSVDALAAGFALNSLQTEWLTAFIFTTVICFILSLTGGFFGQMIGEKFGRKSELIGGAILLGLAFRVVIN